MLSSTGVQWCIGATVVVGLFYAGYQTGAGKVVTVTEHVKGETEIVFRDRIVTVTKIIQKGGTVIEVVKTEEKDKTEKVKTDTNRVAVTAARMKYSLGLLAVPKIIREGGTIKRVSLMPGVSAGYNLGNELWLKLGYVFADSTDVSKTGGSTLSSTYVVGIEIHF